jgi:hypothetical protein
MSIKIIDSSEMKKVVACERDDDNRKDNKDKDLKIEIIPKSHIIHCERIKLGTINNCALCENINKDIFLRCSNKFK